MTRTTRSRVSVEAQAKVNLALELLGKRDDGYHEIATLLQGMTLSDRILLEETEEEVTVSSSDPSIPEGPENLAWRAARLVQEAREVSRGVHIVIEKRIPVAAGLGGGSSDAAAVLLGLQHLWGLAGSPEELRGWATSLGMDVPFFLTGGRVLAEGRGERLTPLPSRPGYHLVVVNPNFPLATRDVYGWVEVARPKPTHGLGPLIAALSRGGAALVGSLLRNDLEPLVAARYPEVDEIRAVLSRAGALGVVMSGSGPTMIAIARSQPHGAAMASAIERRGWSVWVLATTPGPAVRIRPLGSRVAIGGGTDSRAPRRASGSLGAV